VTELIQLVESNTDWEKQGERIGGPGPRVVISSFKLATDSLAGFEYGLVRCRGREGRELF